jgi:hypothetical protein
MLYIMVYCMVYTIWYIPWFISHYISLLYDSDIYHRIYHGIYHMVYTISYIPIAAWHIPSKSAIYHEATFQMDSDRCRHAGRNLNHDARAPAARGRGGLTRTRDWQKQRSLEAADGRWTSSHLLRFKIIHTNCAVAAVTRTFVL